MNWWKKLRGKIRFKEPLKAYTTLKIGGPAKLFFEPLNINDLRLFLIETKRLRLPVLMIGAGSNLLVSDKGICAAVIKLNTPPFIKVSCKDNVIKAGSGLMLSKLIKFTQEHSLSGIEFLAGIPGTVGGALAMNAGAWGKSLGGLVDEVDVMDYRGNIKTLLKDEIKFNYRKSNLSKLIILNASLRLSKDKKENIKKRMKKYLHKRSLAQDISLPSAGCIFKNPTGDSAGRLIDICKLKGLKIGGACVSLKHANFIHNLANASADDFLHLIKIIRREVKKRYNIFLQPEIKIWR